MGESENAAVATAAKVSIEDPTVAIDGVGHQAKLVNC